MGLWDFGRSDLLPRTRLFAYLPIGARPAAESSCCGEDAMYFCLCFRFVSSALRFVCGLVLVLCHLQSARRPRLHVPRLHSPIRRSAAAALLPLLCLAAAAGDVVPTERPPRLSFEEEDRLAAGLILSVEHLGDPLLPSDFRTSRLPALHVAEGEPPTPFSPPGPFRSEFSGYLVLDLSAAVTFSLAGRGTAALELNGKQVLAGEGDLSVAGVVTVALYSGPNRFVLHYDSLPEGDAEVRAIWSQREGGTGSETAFEPEPIPPGQFVHDPEHAGLAAAVQLRRGRELFATHQCHRCHLPEAILRAEGTMPELVGDPPSLVDAGGRFLGPWLYHWMLDRARLRNEVSMPRVLGPAEDDAARQLAADLTVFLSLQGAEPSEAPPVNRGDDSQLVAEGEILYENLGCIACHRFTEPSADDDFQRVSLYYVHEKYRPHARSRRFFDGPWPTIAPAGCPTFV